MRHIQIIITFTYTLLILSTCTENPFFDDEIEVQKNRIVRGVVNLGFDITPSNVYIWMEELNLCDWSDENGNFMIELPPAESQPGNGLNGIYRLYVYAANYQIGTYNLLLINGEFDYDNENLDTKGHFKKTITLQKILDIQTLITPQKIITTAKDPINFQIHLESLVDSVIVKTHFNYQNMPSSIILLKQGDPNENAIFLQGNPAFLDTIIIKGIQIWTVTYIFPPNFFNDGTYQVCPYLQILQENLPEELLLSIDENIFETSYHYLNWPIKQQYGFLKVTKLSN